MSSKGKPRKPKTYKKPVKATCYACGSENIERIPVAHVGVIAICRNCGEQQAN